MIATVVLFAVPAVMCLGAGMVALIAERAPRVITRPCYDTRQPTL